MSLVHYNLVDRAIQLRAQHQARNLNFGYTSRTTLMERLADWEAKNKRESHQWIYSWTIIYSVKSNSRIVFILYRLFLYYICTWRNLSNPPKTRTEKVCDWTHSHSVKPTAKCKTHPTGRTTEPQGEFPRDHEALGPRGGSYILDAESCNIQSLELDRLLFVGNSGRFVETRLRV